MDNKKRIYEIIKVIAVILLLGVLVYNMKLEEVIQYIYLMDFRYLIAAIIGETILFLALAIKWRVLLREVTYYELLNGVLISHMLSYSLGGKLIGETGKIVAIKEKDKAQVLVSVLLDKITGLCGVFLLGWGGIVVSQMDKLDSVRLFYHILGTLFVGGMFVIMNHSLIDFIEKMIQKRTQSKNKIMTSIRTFLQKIVEAFAAYGNRTILTSIIWGILTQTLSMWISWFICQGMCIPMAFADLCWINVIVSLASVVPLSIMGLGIIQVSTISLFVMCGVSKEKAMGFSAIHYFIMVLYAIIAVILSCFISKQGKCRVN